MEKHHLLKVNKNKECVQCWNFLLEQHDALASQTQTIWGYLGVAPAQEDHIHHFALLTTNKQQIYKEHHSRNTVLTVTGHDSFSVISLNT